MSTIDPSVFEPDDVSSQEPMSEHYKIGGKSEADWALRKLAQARAAIKENNALFEAELSRLTAWAKDVNTGPERDALYFEAILRNWHAEQLADDPKAKTIKLPGGKLTARLAPPSLTVDDDVFIPWAQEHRSDWLRVKAEPVKADIKTQLVVGESGDLYDPESGDQVPGVALLPADISWKAATE